MSKSLSIGKIWTMPIVLAVSSGVGLVSALLGDGIWDGLSWIALATPLAVTLRHVVHTGRSR